MYDERRTHTDVSESERSAVDPSGTKPDVRRKLSRRQRRLELVNNFILTAEKYVGHKARPGGESEFGRRSGYSSHVIPWSGSFVDCIANDAGVSLPACVYSPSGLGELLRGRRMVTSPLPGDIVFYTFATRTTDSFSMPHVGIVVDTIDWKDKKVFTAVEGDVDGAVCRFNRENHDVLAFFRPNFNVRPGRTRTQQTDIVSISASKIKIGARGRDVLNVQTALRETVGLNNASPAIFDQSTSAAFSRWQRRIGFVGKDANGIPDRRSLEKLGFDTGIFSVND